MRFIYLATLTALFICQVQFAVIAQQKTDSGILKLSGIIKLIDETNRNIDKAVVAKDLKFLEQHYGNDFVFTHGTGLVEGKNSWIETVKKNKGYASREHDSTQVVLHGNIAIVTGKLTVGRIDPANDGTTKYSLRYVRVFALRKKTWQMISHRTTSEWHHN